MSGEQAAAPWAVLHDAEDLSAHTEEPSRCAAGDVAAGATRQGVAGGAVQCEEADEGAADVGRCISWAATPEALHHEQQLSMAEQEDEQGNVADAVRTASSTGRTLHVVSSALRRCGEECDRLSSALDTLPVSAALTTSTSLHRLAELVAAATPSPCSTDKAVVNTEPDEPCLHISGDTSAVEGELGRVCDLLDVVQRLHRLLAPCVSRVRPRYMTSSVAAIASPAAQRPASPRSTASAVVQGPSPRPLVPEAAAELQRLHGRCAAQEQECARLQRDVAQLTHALATVHVEHERAYMRHIVEEATRRWFLRSPALYTGEEEGDSAESAAAAAVATRWALTAQSSASEDVLGLTEKTKTAANGSASAAAAALAGMTAHGSLPHSRRSVTQPQQQQQQRTCSKPHAPGRPFLPMQTALSQLLRLHGATPRTTNSPMPAPLIAGNALLVNSHGNGNAIGIGAALPAPKASRSRRVQRLQRALEEQHALSAGLQGRLSALEVQLAHTEAQRVALEDTLRQRARSLQEVWAVLGPEQRAQLTEYTSVSSVAVQVARTATATATTTLGATTTVAPLPAASAAAGNGGQTAAGKATSALLPLSSSSAAAAAVTAVQLPNAVGVAVKPEPSGVTRREKASSTSHEAASQTSQPPVAALGSSANDKERRQSVAAAAAAADGQGATEPAAVAVVHATRTDQTQRPVPAPPAQASTRCEATQAAGLSAADPASEIHGLQHKLRILAAQLERVTHDEAVAQARMTELEAQLSEAYAFVQECQKMQDEADAGNAARDAEAMNYGAHATGSPTKPRAVDVARNAWSMTRANNNNNNNNTHWVTYRRAALQPRGGPNARQAVSPARRRLWHSVPSRTRRAHRTQDSLRAERSEQTAGESGRTRLTYRSPIRRGHAQFTTAAAPTAAAGAYETSMPMMPSHNSLNGITDGQTTWEAMRNGRHLFVRPSKADLMARVSSSLPSHPRYAMASRAPHAAYEPREKKEAAEYDGRHSHALYSPHAESATPPTAHRLTPPLTTTRRTRWRSRTASRARHLRRRQRRNNNTSNNNNNIDSEEKRSAEPLDRRISHAAGHNGDEEDYNIHHTEDYYTSNDEQGTAGGIRNGEASRRYSAVRRASLRRGRSVSIGSSCCLRPVTHAPAAPRRVSAEEHTRPTAAASLTHQTQWPMLAFSRSHSHSHMRHDPAARAFFPHKQGHVHNSYHNTTAGAANWYYSSSRLSPSAAYASRRLSQRIAAWTRPAWNASPALQDGLVSRSALATRYFADARPPFSSLT